MILVFLLICILQNRAPLQTIFLIGAVPTGVALLFSTVSGALAIALPRDDRMLRLRRAVHRDGNRPR